MSDQWLSIYVTFRRNFDEVFFFGIKIYSLCRLKCTSNIRAGIKLIILIFILQYLYASESIEWHVKKDIVIFEE